MGDIAGGVESVPAYTGPIFDGDTHIYEQPDSWSRYLPKQYEKDWGFNWKVGKNGQYALYIGPNRKVEVSAGYFTEDGRAPRIAELRPLIADVAARASGHRPA